MDISMSSKEDENVKVGRYEEKQQNSVNYNIKN